MFIVSIFATTVVLATFSSYHCLYDIPITVNNTIIEIEIIISIKEKAFLLCIIIRYYNIFKC